MMQRSQSILILRIYIRASIRVFSGSSEEFEASGSTEDDVSEEEQEQPVSVYCSVSSLPSQVPEMEEYENYSGGTTQDPRGTDAQSVMEGLIKIVEVEGPMLAKRSYDVYLRHCGIKRMGKDLKRSMNRALQQAINKGLLTKSDEWEVGGLLHSIIHLPDRCSPRLRNLGGRTVDEM
jgi:hypothetical protein